ncbi:MAG: aldehyde dehydrogenase family protein [Gammaproteobacteria bacterium]|nr:aldehyde dehydrogenase family protein [Gammaproteobacteria bacterium]
MKSAGHYIAGKWSLDKSGEALQSVDPLYGLTFWQGQAVTLKQIQLALIHAKAAATQWSDLALIDRRAKMIGLLDALNAHHPELSLIIAQESGRPVWLVEHALHSLIKHMSNLPLNNNRRPLGVVAIFGSPSSLNYIAQTFEVLLYGNASILFSLPGSRASLEKLMQLWENLKLPTGLIQLLHTDNETASGFAKLSEIDGLIFEGDAQTAAMFKLEAAQQSAKYIQICSPSANPLIIKDVSDIEGAAYLAVQSAFLNSGQGIHAAKRLIIASDANGDAILDAIIAMTRSLRIAAYDANPAPFMSAMATPYAAQQALAVQAALLKQGAEIRLPMKLIQGGTGLLSPGITVLSPTIQVPVVSGPFLQVFRADSSEHCIELANLYSASIAGIISEDLNLVNRYAAICKAEQLYYNAPMQGYERFHSIHYPEAKIIQGSLDRARVILPGIKLAGATPVTL